MKAGDLVKWTGKGGRTKLWRQCHGDLSTDDVGLIIRLVDSLEIGVTELYVMIKGRFEYFQIEEVISAV